MRKSQYSINKERWFQLDLLEQLANIGAEVGRTLNKKKQNRNYLPSLERALELFALTVQYNLQETKRWYKNREVLRIKDQFLRALTEKDDPKLEKYFNYIAIASRKKTARNKTQRS